MTVFFFCVLQFDRLCAVDLLKVKNVDSQVGKEDPVSSALLSDIFGLNRDTHTLVQPNQSGRGRMLAPLCCRCVRLASVS